MEKIYKKLVSKYSLSSTFVSMLFFYIIVHGYAMTNFFYNHDSAMMIIDDDMWQFSLGRWLVPFYNRYIRGGVVSHWTTMVLSFLALYTICVFISDAFEFRLYQTICLSAVLSVNITMVCYYSTYMEFSDSQIISLALGTAAIWLINRYKRWVHSVSAILLICASLAIYQAQINFALGFAVLIMIDECLKRDMSIKEFLLRGLYYVSHIFVGGIIYIIGMFLANKRYHVELSDSYNGPGALLNSEKGPLSAIIEGFNSSMKYFISYFTQQLKYISPLMSILAVILIISSVTILLYITVTKKRNLIQCIELVILIILFPISLNAMFVLTGGMIHTLMIFSYNLVFVLCIYSLGILVNSDIHSLGYLRCNEIHNYNEDICNTQNGKIKHGSIIKNIFIGLNIVWIIISVFYVLRYANVIYLEKKLAYEQTARMLTEIWKDIGGTDGYVEGETTVIFAIRNDDYAGNIGYINEGFSKYTSETPFVGVDISSPITYSWTLLYSWNNIVGRNTRVIIDEHIIEENEDVASMPCFPSNGYIKQMGDSVIVRISR